MQARRLKRVNTGDYILKRTAEFWRGQIQKVFASKRETNEIDFKLTLSDNTDRLTEHINAFGNGDGGGMFVFGVTNSFRSDPDLFAQQDAVAKTVSNLAVDTQVPPLAVENFTVQLCCRGSCEGHCWTQCPYWLGSPSELQFRT